MEENQVKGGDLLDVLKSELALLESGGYRNCFRDWRPRFILEHTAQRKRNCFHCVLLQMVPSDRRDEQFPCRHIPLNEFGETINSFSRAGSEEDLEGVLTVWLRATIQRLEEERREN